MTKQIQSFKDANGVKTKVGELVSIVGHGSDKFTSIYPVSSIRRSRRVIEVVLYDAINKFYIQSESVDLYNEEA